MVEQMTYPTREATGALGVGLHSFHQAVREERVPALRVGRKPRLGIPPRAVERLLKDPTRWERGEEQR
jgi:hypothetical protein